MALIEVRGVSTVFGPAPNAALARVHAGVTKADLLRDTGHQLALHGVDLSIEAGELFVVMGPSGSGKSTLLRHLNRLIDPTQGGVHIGGADVLALSPAALIELRRQRIAMVFQGFGLLPHRRVLDNVALPLELRGQSRTVRETRAREWIARVGLQGYEHQWPAHLSGGMQQRVGLARALCADTDIVLMDEPFSGLDPLTRTQLQDELLALQRDMHRTIVFITHDAREALHLADRIAILREGVLVQVATPAELLLHPADPQVAAFTRAARRIEVLTLACVIESWPAACPLPALDEAVDIDLPVEQALPRLLGRHTPLAVRHSGRIVGQVSVDAVRAMLDAG